MTMGGPTIKIVDQIVALDQSLTATLNQLIGTVNQLVSTLNATNALLSNLQTLMGAGLPATLATGGRMKVSTNQ